MSRRKLISLILVLMLGAYPLAYSLAPDVSSQDTAADSAPRYASFAEYQQATRQYLLLHRHFQTADHEAELEWNSPQEWRPASVARKGILLVHRLGDSPWSFSDLGPALAKQGFLVRTMLLPGHGTQPADLIPVDLEDWRRALRDQVKLMQRDVPRVYLGGFSTGGNLTTEYALEHPEIAGLLLVSPAFKSKSAFDWLTPWLSHIRPWLRSENGPRPQQTALRYLNTPTNGFAQFYRSSYAVRQLLDREHYDKPVVIAVTEHDSVLDVRYILQTFNQRFTNPQSRLIWYGRLPEDSPASPRVLVKTDYLPEQRISQFSHMGMLFAPDNRQYGVDGKQRLCWNGQSAPQMQRCLAGDPVWYSDWGYTEANKVHARLTFNPYFAWQESVIAATLGGR